MTATNKSGQDSLKVDALEVFSLASSDEVFTPPSIVRDLIDLIAEHNPGIFSNPDAKFLDPFTKSGVFLREITRKLIEGLEHEIPDLQQRIDHILTYQVFGIAITKLTSLIARRTLYYSRNADSDYSLCSSFRGVSGENQGNVAYKKHHHTFVGNQCIFCSANKKTYDRDVVENYAYKFIHSEKSNNSVDEYMDFLNDMFTPSMLKRLRYRRNGENTEMKFDVIVGNPPYQLKDGGHGASAVAIYHRFIEQAIQLNPNYLAMIVPARWVTGAGRGKGLTEFTRKMLNNEGSKIREFHDFIESKDCFPDVEIAGGVCYFLWDGNYKETGTDKDLVKIVTHIKGDKKGKESNRKFLEGNNTTLIRLNDAVNIVKKIQAKCEQTLDQYVSSQKPFGLRTNYDSFQESPSAQANVKLYLKTAGFSEGYIPDTFVNDFTHSLQVKIKEKSKEINDFKQTLSEKLLKRNQTIDKLNNDIDVLEKKLSIAIKENKQAIVDSLKEKIEKKKQKLSLETYNVLTYKHENQSKSVQKEFDSLANKEKELSELQEKLQWIPSYKVLLPRSTSGWTVPIIAEPNSCCTESYVVVSGFCSSDDTIAKNIVSYVNTKFFHFLLSLVKSTQDSPARVYSFIPVQDFTEEWTDEKLYAKYGITSEEQEFIEEVLQSGLEVYDSGELSEETEINHEEGNDLFVESK